MKGSSIQMIIQFVNRQSKEPTRIWQALIRQVLPGALPTITRLQATAASGQALDQSAPGAAGNGSLSIQDVPAEPTLVVTFAGPIVMRRINRETRGVDRLTDVLSFPLLQMREGNLTSPPGPQDHEQTPGGWTLLPLGDVVIAPEVARQQALDFGHSMDREMAFLALHGLLHLLGYDHDTPEREAAMTFVQEAVLTAAGLTRPYA